jgi:hypothetical protein
MDHSLPSSRSRHGLTAVRQSARTSGGKRRIYAKAVDWLELSAACLVPSLDQYSQLCSLLSYLDATSGAEFEQFCASFDYEGFLDLALSSSDEPIVVGAVACVAACSWSRRFRARDFATQALVDRLLALLNSELDHGRESAMTLLARIAGHVIGTADWLFEAHLASLSALPPTFELGSLIVELTRQPRAGVHVQVIDVARGLLARDTEICLSTQGFQIVVNCFANLSETMEVAAGDIWRGIDANVDFYFQQDDADFAEVWFEVLLNFAPLEAPFAGKIIAQVGKLLETGQRCDDALAAAANLLWRHREEWAAEGVVEGLIEVFEELPFAAQAKFLRVMNRMYDFRAGRETALIMQMTQYQLRFCECAENQLTEECLANLIALLGANPGNQEVVAKIGEAIEQFQALLESESEAVATLADQLIAMLEETRS